jgi:hypothetical protein
VHYFIHIGHYGIGMLFVPEYSIEFPERDESQLLKKLTQVKS